MTAPQNVSIEEKFKWWLGQLRGVEECGDGYYKACCPAHDDHSPSLTTQIGEKGIIATCHADCTFAEICHSMGVLVAWTFRSRANKDLSSGDRGELVATFDYRDADGELQYQSCRFEKTEPGGQRTKSFLQRRPTENGGWSYKLKGVSKLPYRLPELLEADVTEPVLIVEGEKHVDRLRELGFVATCNSGGAGKWQKSFSPHLKGRHVVILPDNDEPGRKHARDVASKLKKSASSIRVVTLPDLPPKGDILDWLDAGGTAEALRSLIDSSKPGDLSGVEEQVAAEPIDAGELLDESRRIVDALGLVVFGQDADRRVKVFALHHRKTEVIRDVSKLQFTDLLMICGPDARAVVHRSDNDKPDGTWRMSEIREAIATLAGYRRIDDQSELGVGVWECRSASREEPSVVLVGAGEAAILNGAPGLQRQTRPEYGDHILELSASDPWFDFETVANHINNWSTEWSESVVEELESLFGQWRYADQDVVPAVLTGLVLASWIQTVWRWRPQVSISGKSNSGKTTMFGVLAGELVGERGLFGRLAVKSSDSTAAGIRQTVKSSAKIIIVDEMEAGKHRNEILEMLRNSGRGDQTLRGTAGQKSMSFTLRHIAWISATETGLRKEADVNRFIMIELLRPPEDEMGKMVIPEDDDLQDLGQRSLAVAVTIARPAKALADKLAKVRVPGVHNRTRECYSVPAACYAVATGASDEQAEEIFRRMLASAPDVIDTSEGDEDRLLAAILNSVVAWKGADRASIAQLIDWRDSSDGYDAREALEKYGIDIVTPTGHPRQTWIDGEEEALFVNTAAAETHFLRGTDWQHSNVIQLLKRIQKAVVVRRRVKGRSLRGVLLPMSRISNQSGEEAF